MSPDARGYFGSYGGCFVPETLKSPLKELEKFYLEIFKKKPEIQKIFKEDLSYFVGRPTPLYHAHSLSRKLGGGQIYLKREDLAHTGAHKINNTVGQALLAKYLGKKRLIAETGAGQHGVATATVAARLGFECCIYMGETDMKRQEPNVRRMRILGAEVIPVYSGSKTLKDALNEALRNWVARVDDTFYVIGSVTGPYPYPLIVRDFQAVIGHEVKSQLQQRNIQKPDALVACIGGGSNALGLFYPFLQQNNIKMYGVEAAGQGIHTGKHAATLSEGNVGVLHGSRSYLLMNAFGQVQETYSISAGLDYPGVGPEHAWLKDQKRVCYSSVHDKEALDAFHMLSRTEGIIPALESSHALAFAEKLAKTLKPAQIIVVNLSGRGDKDIQTVSQYNTIKNVL